MANELRYRATIKDDVSGPLERIKDRFGQLRAQGAKPILQGLAIGAGIAAFDLLSNAVSGAVDWLAQSVTKAAEEEVSIARLTASLEANAKGWDGNAEAIEAVIAQREQLAFSDDEQRDSLAMLVARTKDVNEALDLQRQAMDLARLRGIELATASEIIGKVYSGNVGILSRYGIAVSKGATATEALAEIQNAAAGQAEAFGDTTAGVMQSTAIAIENLQEDIGTEFAPVLKEILLWVRDEGVPALSGLIEGLKDVGEMAEQAALGLAYLKNPEAFMTLMENAANTRASIDEVRAAIEAAGLEMPKLEANADDAGDTMGDAGAKANVFAGSLDDVGDEADDARAELKRMERAAEDALDAFIEAALGPKELKLRLIESKDELRENTREAEQTRNKIDRLREAGRPVGELKDDLRDLKLEIIDNKEEVIRNTAKLEDMGEVPMGATERAIARLLGPLNDVEQAAWDAYAALRAVGGGSSGGGSGGGGSSGGGRRRKRGGVVPDSGSFSVGEDGIEERLVMFPGGGGMVIPGAGGSQPSGSGGGGNVYINVSTPALTPGGAQALADAIAPHITRWQQVRGL